MKKMGRPRKQFKRISKTSQEGTLEGEVRATFIVREEDLKTVKGLALLEKKKIKEVVGEAFDALFALKKKGCLQEALSNFDGKKGEDGIG